MRKIDLTSQKFGKLTVKSELEPTIASSGKKCSTWEVQCECGIVTAVRAANLRNGNTKSCGHCDRDKRHFVHGGRSTSEYGTYCAAIQRCTNPKNPRFGRYGKRGIKFLFANFADFIEDLGPRPRGYVLDRIDNDGNYEKGNMQWVTKSQSIQNSSKCLGGRKSKFAS